MVAEGYYATKNAYEINNQKTAPACANYQCGIPYLYQDKNPRHVFKELSKNLD